MCPAQKQEVCLEAGRLILQPYKVAGDLQSKIATPLSYQHFLLQLT